MKRMLSIILAVTLVLSLSTFTAFAGNGNGKDKDKDNGNGHKVTIEFKDTKGHWGQKSIEKIQSKGILEGYSDGTFLPDKAITEAELAVIIDRLYEARMSDDDDDESIIDVDDSDSDDEELSDVPAWAKKAVLRGFEKNYFNQKRFHSHVQASRLMTCVAIAKYLEREGELTPVTDFSKVPFKDRVIIGEENLGYILALYEEGYIKGYPDGNFNPNKLITRAQFAAIIEKILEDELASDDDNAPTWNNDAEVKADDVEATSLKLEWSGARDDVKVTGYKIILEVDDKTKTTKYVTGTTAVVGGLEPDTEYKFTVEARDAAGNWSGDGPSVTVTTDEAVEDEKDPSWSDEGITATAIRVSSVDLEWWGATDDVKVVAYKVTYELDDTTKTKYFYGTTGRISGLEADEEYTFTVEAKDAAGNWSDDGPSVEVTTLDEDTVDVKAPTWPDDAELEISESDGVVKIEWPDAEDNVGVFKYKVYKDGQYFKTLDDDVNQVRISGLDEDTEYTFKVRAVDAAGNLSDGLEDTYTTD